MKAVFDCMVLLQALANRHGPSGECFRAVEAGRVTLLVSNATLLELEDLLQREQLRTRFILSSDPTVRAFIDRVVEISQPIRDVPLVRTLPRDPKDEKYLNLAIAADAAFVVSRDSHLLDLMTATDAPATLFRAAFPTIEILRPELFLTRLPQVP